MPVSTTAQIEHSRMLFSTSAPSREIGAKIPVGAMTGARNANSSSEPPITMRQQHQDEHAARRVVGEGCAPS